MNRILKIVFLLSMISFLHCAFWYEKAFQESGKEFEGWGGDPNTHYQKPFDFFYMPATGRASSEAQNKRYGPMMQTTCTDAAITGLKGNMIGKLIGETAIVEPSSTIRDRESPRTRIIIEFKNELQGVNIKECKPLFTDEPTLPYSGWKECECVIYIKILGGKERVLESYLRKTN